MHRFAFFLLFSLVSTVAQEAEIPPADESPGSPPVADYPDPEAVVRSMKRAAAYYRTSLSHAGGYGISWPRDLSEARAENRASITITSIQPPGTPTVGMTMLEAFRATGDPLFRQGAIEAADALGWCQLASGGWGSEFDYDRRKASLLHFRRDLDAGDVWAGRRTAHSSLDDNKTQSVLTFLLELAHTDGFEKDADLRHALDFAFESLLAAQAPNGGWPQRFTGPADPSLPVKPAVIPEDWPREWSDVPYDQFYTLNDGNLLHLTRLLLRAHELEGDPRFLEAVKRLGDFLILAQLPEPQPGWAQQYNFAMEPVWARRFEPPAVSSGESFGAMRTLFEVWLATGEEKYLQPIAAGLKWLQESEIGNDTWARFYELGTNRPLYCEAETYQLTYDDSNLPTHYGFQVSGSFARKIREFAEDIKRSRIDILAEEARRPANVKEWTNQARKRADEARDAMRAQRREGMWLNEAGDIDADLFADFMEEMTDYVIAANAAGDAYRETWRKAESERKIRLAGLVLTEAERARAGYLLIEAAANRADVVCCPLDLREHEALAKDLGIRLVQGEEFTSGNLRIQVGPDSFTVLDKGDRIKARSVSEKAELYYVDADRD